MITIVIPAKAGIQNENAETAIVREKQIKEWKRKWKLELIETSNPDWRDLFEEMAN